MFSRVTQSDGLPGVQWKNWFVVDRRDWEMNPTTKSEYFSAHFTTPTSPNEDKKDCLMLTHPWHNPHWQSTLLWKTFAQLTSSRAVRSLLVLPEIFRKERANCSVTDPFPLQPTCSSAWRIPSPGRACTVTRSAHSAMRKKPLVYCSVTVFPISANFLDEKKREADFRTRISPTDLLAAENSSCEKSISILESSPRRNPWEYHNGSSTCRSLNQLVSTTAKQVKRPIPIRLVA